MGTLHVPVGAASTFHRSHATPTTFLYWHALAWSEQQSALAYISRRGGPSCLLGLTRTGRAV
jgi:hypothetical protein